MVRLRRRRRRTASGGWAAAIFLPLSVAGVLALGAAMVAGGRVIFAAAADLPPASSLESFFGQPGSERFRAPQLFDRTGEALLAEVIHPLARERRWQPLDRLPAAVGEATVAALDPSFWTNPGYDPTAVTQLVVQSVLGGTMAARPGTITERLAQQTLVRGQGSPLAALMLANDIAAAYSKERVLEWFLNSADYGNLACGIDAAARVYLGKPADGLTVGEAALLAALPAHPEVDPFVDPAAARAMQRDVLASMRLQGLITGAQEQAAQAEVIPLQADEARQAMQGLGFVQVVWEELRARIGAGAAAQGGARVITTLDLDLQLQADCVARSYLARMDGGDPLSVLPAADGSPCAAAALLDPATGEVWALTGAAGEARPPGSVLAPLIYLSAFSRGYTPATMVIDTEEGGEARGPVRLRTALAEGDASVGDHLLALLGPAVVESTLDLMGLDPAAVAAGG